MLSYITYEQLANDVRLLIRQLPQSVVLDLIGVLGIPRSGMLPATMIAAHLHLPLTDCYSFIRFGCRFTTSGKRLKAPPQGRTILVVDDSIYHGNGMTDALSVIDEANSGYHFVSAAVYRCPERQPPVHFFARDITKPRYFEWNLMQHSDMPDFMLDLDGVICYDQTVSEDENFALILKDADPLHLPSYPAHSICTMRLERYRLITEKWLGKHRVQYGCLHMVNMTLDERRKTLNYGEWKGQRYKDSEAKLFIESDSKQAPIINYVSKKPVICLTTGKVHQDENSSSNSLPE